MQKQIIELSLKRWQVTIWSSVCCIYTFLQTAWYICTRDFLSVWQCLSVSWCATVLNVLNAVNIITIIPSKSNFSIVVIHLHVRTAALKFYRHLLYLSWLEKGLCNVQLRPCNREWSFCIILLCALPMLKPNETFPLRQCLQQTLSLCVHCIRERAASDNFPVWLSQPLSVCWHADVSI